MFFSVVSPKTIPNKQKNDALKTTKYDRRRREEPSLFVDSTLFKFAGPAQQNKNFLERYKLQTKMNSISFDSTRTKWREIHCSVSFFLYLNKIYCINSFSNFNSPRPPPSSFYLSQKISAALDTPTNFYNGRTSIQRAPSSVNRLTPLFSVSPLLFF